MSGTIVWSDATHVTISGDGSYEVTILNIPTGLTFSGTPFLMVGMSRNWNDLLSDPLQIYDSGGFLIDSATFSSEGDVADEAADNDPPNFPAYAKMNAWKGACIAGLAGGGSVKRSGFADVNGVTMIGQGSYDLVTVGVLYDSPNAAATSTGVKNQITSSTSTLTGVAGVTPPNVVLGPVVYMGMTGGKSSLGSPATWSNPADANGTWTNITSLVASNLQVTAALYTPTDSFVDTPITNTLNGCPIGTFTWCGQTVQCVPIGRPATSRSFAVVIG